MTTPVTISIGDRAVHRLAFGRPEDIAGIATYLASNASSWHTGDVTTVDEGVSAR